VITYDLSYRIHWRLAFLVVRLEPEDKCSEWLRRERLDHKDYSEQYRFPACHKSNNGFNRVGLAFRSATGLCHPLICDLNILCHGVSESNSAKIVVDSTYSLGEDPIRLGSSRGIR
jgi:hypothetical protein